MRNSTLFAPALLTVMLIVGSLQWSGDDRALLADELRGCDSVTPAALNAYAGTIERALKSAQKDARANGTDGSYAVAATNARDLLKRAQARIEDGADKLRATDPRVTTYAEGGMIKEHVRNSLDWMSEAGHWALISAIYHESTDARDAFEGTIEALADGQTLFAESGRCYMSGYL